MRVLWTHNYDPTDECSGTFMYTAARALSKLGVEIEFAYLGNLRRPTGIIRGARLTRSLAAKFDLVHAQFGSATALATASVTGRPLVISIRGSDWTRALNRDARYKAHARFATAMTRASLSRYSLAVCVSNRIRDEVSSHSVGLRAIVLPDPIDTDLFVPRDKLLARSALGLELGDIKYAAFTSVNRDNPNKRLWLAEEAIAWANAHGHNVRLLVASGYSPDHMPTLMAAADVAICTSSAEGWPNCIKEALACNVPFVSTDVSDLAQIADADEICRIAGASGPELGAAMCEVLEKAPPKDLRHHLAPMTMDVFSTGLLHAYEAVLRQHKP